MSTQEVHDDATTHTQDNVVIGDVDGQQTPVASDNQAHVDPPPEDPKDQLDPNSRDDDQTQQRDSDGSRMYQTQSGLRTRDHSPSSSRTTDDGNRRRFNVPSNPEGKGGKKVPNRKKGKTPQKSNPYQKNFGTGAADRVARGENKGRRAAGVQGLIYSEEELAAINQKDLEERNRRARMMNPDIDTFTERFRQYAEETRRAEQGGKQSSNTSTSKTQDQLRRDRDQEDERIARAEKRAQEERVKEARLAKQAQQKRASPAFGTSSSPPNRTTLRTEAEDEKRKLEILKELTALLKMSGTLLVQSALRTSQP